MANTVSILSYGNTFGELVTTQNALARENNALAANNYTKETGTLFLSDPDLGLQVANNAVVQGGLKVQGIGSYARVDNNLRVDGQIYFTNNTIGMTNFGQANVYGLLYANASGNSIISTNNVTVGGNTFITGNVYSSNNLVVSKNTTIGGETLIRGTTNVANNLLVSSNAYVSSVVISDKAIANTSTVTPIAYVTGLLDAGLATSQLHVVTANNLTSTRGYISTLQSNTSINSAAVNTTTLYAQSLSTPVANVINTFDANNAAGFLKDLTVSGQLTITGSMVSTAPTVYTANTFTLAAGSLSGITSAITVNRGTTGEDAAFRWNETQDYWDILNVSNSTYYQVLTTNEINNTLTSTSTTRPASANAANTLYNLLNAANNYLQLAVVNAGNFANAGFGHANSAYDAANNVAPQIAPTFDRANAAYGRANTAANTFVGTNGQITATNGSLSFTSTNGVTLVGSGNTFTVNTPQDVRTTASPVFNNLTLTNALAVTQGGTGAQSSAVALQNLLPSTVGVPSGYVLGTTGGLGASFNWVSGGTGGGGGAQPGTRITTNRLSYTASTNQTDFTTPTYVTGSGQLRVYVNGVRQYTSDYTELSSTEVRLNSPLTSGDTVLVEVDGYYTWVNSANVTTFTAPFGGISASANTVQLAIESIETRKAPLVSPSFTGVPTGTKASMSTSNTWIATTNWVTEWANQSYTLSSSITGNAGSVTNGVYTNGSYTDPTWLTLTKSKVGLNNVNNTADADKTVFAASYASTANSVSNITLQSGLGTSSNTRFSSLGVGTDASGTSGEIRATNNITAYYGQSDKRLKENIVPMSGALENIDSFGAYNFNYKTRPGQKMIGVIAQELMEIYPELVYEIKPIDEGTGLEKSYAVNYELLSVVLLQAVKELKAEVEVLKGKTK